MTMDFSEKRLSYEKGELLEENLPNLPKDLLTQWIQDALDAKVVEPYAMSLATCSKDNVPSVRTVLMREITEVDDNRFSIVFYTNYDSEKGNHIAENPNVQSLFFWHSLERQVRVTGRIEKLDKDKSVAYFHKRPKDSQIAAWVSEPQSGVVTNRDVMEQKYQQLQEQYAEENLIPMPDFWGGYQLIVSKAEFWQGRANRMHDRIVYQQDADNNWYLQRLLP